MTGIQPAPKQLAQLAEAMRGWPYDEIRAAIIACSQAGWPDDRIYRETFRLLLFEDAGPGDLRLAARDPRQRDPRQGPGLPSREDTLELLAEYRAKVAGQAAASDDPEGGEAA